MTYAAPTSGALLLPEADHRQHTFSLCTKFEARSFIGDLKTKI